MTESPHSANGAAGQIDLSNQFIMAMPGQVEGSLAGTVIYICEHTEKGALGLVLNRPTDLTLGGLLERLELQPGEDHDAAAAADDAEAPVYFGGPVQTDRGFVLHEPVGHWSSTLMVIQGLGLTSSRDILEASAKGKGPKRFLVALGYSGWSPGQLDSELGATAWLTVPVHDTALFFETPPEDRLGAAFRMLGVDPANLSGAFGRA